jgi:cysteine synthase A
VKVVDTILDAVGNTPMVRLMKVTQHDIFAKAEFLNPGGSVKDRVAKYLIEEAEHEGRLKKGSTIMEPTSGNTGIGITLVGVQKGYRVIIVMPENMSEGGIEGAVKKTMEMAAADSSIFVPQQFENPKNPEIHYLSTGPEIWEQMDGQVEFFVAGVGSGGTLGGVGKYLKEQRRQIKLIAVEPQNSAALLGHEPGLHQIQGIGDGFIPTVLDTSIIDGVITVTDEDAIEMTRRLAKEEGLLVGTSSGANVWAAIRLAERGKGNIVTVLPDRAERYFSTSLI